MTEVPLELNSVAKLNQYAVASVKQGYDQTHYVQGLKAVVSLFSNPALINYEAKDLVGTVGENEYLEMLGRLGEIIVDRGYANPTEVDASNLPHGIDVNGYYQRERQPLPILKSPFLRKLRFYSFALFDVVGVYKANQVDRKVGDLLLHDVMEAMFSLSDPVVIRVSGDEAAVSLGDRSAPDFNLLRSLVSGVMTLNIGQDNEAVPVKADIREIPKPKHPHRLTPTEALKDFRKNKGLEDIEISLAERLGFLTEAHPGMKEELEILSRVPDSFKGKEILVELFEAGLLDDVLFAKSLELGYRFNKGVYVHRDGKEFFETISIGNRGGKLFTVDVFAAPKVLNDREDLGLEYGDKLLQHVFENIIELVIDKVPKAHIFRNGVVLSLWIPEESSDLFNTELMKSLKERLGDVYEFDDRNGVKNTIPLILGTTVQNVGAGEQEYEEIFPSLKSEQETVLFRDEMIELTNYLQSGRPVPRELFEQFSPNDEKRGITRLLNLGFSADELTDLRAYFEKNLLIKAFETQFHGILLDKLNLFTETKSRTAGFRR